MLKRVVFIIFYNRFSNKKYNNYMLLVTYYSYDSYILVMIVLTVEAMNVKENRI